MSNGLASGASRGSDPRIVSCEVWLADIAVELPAHLALLDPVERGRRAKYRLDVDKTRFTVAAALLRLVVAGYTGMQPGSVRVDRSCSRCGDQHGKPQIPDADLHVSVSHSGDKVALAITGDAPIGVDVETITQRDVVGLSRSVLSSREALGRAEDFYTYWCRKEAVVKATGDGLRVPLPDVVVSPADAAPRVISYRGAPLVAAVSDLAVGPGYAAAVAVLADGDLRVQVRDASALMSMTQRWTEAVGSPPVAHSYRGATDGAA
jgi:4'-phosphopantetheinyl transferase